MKRQHDLRGMLSFALAGFLCSLIAGCGQGSGDEFRTYEQTVADVAPVEDFGNGNTDSAPDESDVPVLPADTIEADGLEASTTDSVDSDSGGDTEVAVESPGTMTGTDAPDEAPEVTPEGEGPGDEAVATAAETLTGVAGDEPATPGPPRRIELLIPENTFTAEGPEGALRVSYDDIDLLKVLNMDPVPPTAVRYFPNWLSGLDGKRVRIRGFMYPPPIESGIPAFLLARDNQICCFGRNPMPYDIVPVILRDDVTTDYINGRPFDVVGVFHVGVEMDLDDPTKVKTVYYIDDAIVIDE